MPTLIALRGVIAGAVLIATAGCASRSQLAKVHAEKEQLKALVEAEKKRNEELVASLQTASERAAEAERELALASEGGKRPRPSTLVKTEVRSGEGSTSLEQWAKSEPLLKYNAPQRSARVQIELAFNNDDQLTFDARRELDKVADLLSSRNGARYGARIVNVEATAGDVHSAARAEATADYLRRRGIAAGRIDAASRSAASLVDEEGRKIGSTGQTVQIELVERSSGESVATDPAAKGDGWTSTGSGRR